LKRERRDADILYGDELISIETGRVCIWQPEDEQHNGFFPEPPE